jgi:hypothetical protein
MIAARRTAIGLKQEFNRMGYTAVDVPTYLHKWLDEAIEKALA